MDAIKPQDLIASLESIIEDIKENGYDRPKTHDIRDELLGLVDWLYCKSWCDDEDDCCYDENVCKDCEYKDTCENKYGGDDYNED